MSTSQDYSQPAALPGRDSTSPTDIAIQEQNAITCLCAQTQTEYLISQENSTFSSNTLSSLFKCAPLLLPRLKQCARFGWGRVFLIAAIMGLCFEFLMKSVLAIVKQGLHSTKAFSDPHPTLQQEAWGYTRSWEKTYPGADDPN